MGRCDLVSDDQRGETGDGRCDLVSDLSGVRQVLGDVFLLVILA